jgi:pyridoxal 5'-phosphate synthase pdxS subunit
MGKEELAHQAVLRAPLELVEWVAQHGNCRRRTSAGGIATPVDAALVMQLGAEAVFVGSDFKSSDPAVRANAIVKAAKNYSNPEETAGPARWESHAGLDFRFPKRS